MGRVDAERGAPGTRDAPPWPTRGREEAVERAVGPGVGGLSHATLAAAPFLPTPPMRNRFLRPILFVASTLLSAGVFAQAAPDRLKTTGDAVIAALKRNDLASIEAQFSRQMKAIYPHDKFVETWAQITKEAGALDHCDAPAREPFGKITALNYPCTFERATMRMRIAINAQNKLEALSNDQVASTLVAPSAAASTAEPATPSPYPTEDIMVGASGWPLPGTFTSPTNGGRTPIAVFVHDTGPHDRDETIGGARVFRDLADGLAARGVSSVRYDKRSLAQSKRFAELKNWTMSDETIDDAVAALAYAASRPNAGPLVIVGYGMGARLAPRIASAAAAQNIPVDSVVMIAPTLTPVEDMLVEEVEFQADLPQPLAKPEAVDDIRTRRDNVKRLITASTDAPQPPASTPLVYPLGYPLSAWRDLAEYDPGSALLARPDLPALLVFAGRDYQTPLREKRYWQQRLVGRKDTMVVEFASLNHLLVEGRGPITPAEYSRPGHVADEVVDRIASWITRRTRAGR